MNTQHLLVNTYSLGSMQKYKKKRLLKQPAAAQLSHLIHLSLLFAFPCSSAGERSLESNVSDFLRNAIVRYSHTKFSVSLHIRCFVCPHSTTHVECLRETLWYLLPRTLRYIIYGDIRNAQSKMTMTLWGWRWDASRGVERWGHALLLLFWCSLDSGSEFVRISTASQ